MIRRAALFAAVALVLPGCAVLGFGGPCGGTEIIGLFDDVGDLVENSNVQSQDVVIGSVTDISLRGWDARVTMCLDSEHRIPQDARAVVRSTSLLGEKFVDLQFDRSTGPYLSSGAVIGVDDTDKSTELEDVLASLGSILGTGNLQKLNDFTSAQAEILDGRSGDLKKLLRRLRRFTGVLAEHKQDIALAVDSLDDVAGTVLDDSDVLEDFLDSFAVSSAVLADQREELGVLLASLERFANVSSQLLRETEGNLNRQFRDLRPVLRTVAANSKELSEGLRTLATFTEWFPESMPGDYLQLDVCQALPEQFDQGVTCPQADENDDPNRAAPRSPSALELLFRDALGGDD